MEVRRSTHHHLNPFAPPFYPFNRGHYFITPLQLHHHHHTGHHEAAVVVPGRPLQQPHRTKSSSFSLRYHHPSVPTRGGPRNRKESVVGRGSTTSDHNYFIKNNNNNTNKNGCRAARLNNNNINNIGCRAMRLKKNQETMPLHPNDKATTSVMIRNIPNNYTRSLLVEFLEEHCKNENEKQEYNTTTTTTVVRSAFDFVYLPIDFKNQLNAGYAFVNFTTPEAAWNFHKSVTGKTWKLFQSKKIADVTRAKIQGKEAMSRNFERMKLRSPSEEYLPVWFEPPRDGCVKSPSSSTMHTIGDVVCC